MVLPVRYLSSKTGKPQKPCVNQWIKAADQVFDIIFLDPPFGKNMIEQSLSLLAESECVSEQTLIYVESESAWQAEKNVEVIKQAKAGQVHYMLLKTAAD